MSEVVVSPVRTRTERRQFLDLAWRLYESDPLWIPPLRHNQRQLLGYARHPFHAVADVQTFLARRDGQVCGRIAAILNHAHNKHYQEERGFFGYFESIDDQAVADALFNAVRGWLAERNITLLRGPFNPSVNYESGLLVDGFDSSPTFMMTYNPPFYERLLETYGFRKTHDLYAYVGHVDQLPETERRLGPLADQAAARSNAIVRPLNASRFKEEVRGFLDIYNQSLMSMWGFVPMSEDELKHMAASLRHLLVPELTLLAIAEGKLAGAILGLPDYNPRIKQIDGRLFPFGFMRLLSRKRDVKRIRVVSINVLPEYQRWGLGLVLMRGLVPKCMEMGVEEAEFSWVAEDNDLARMGLEKGGAKIAKTYRVFDLAQ